MDPGQNGKFKIPVSGRSKIHTRPPPYHEGTQKNCSRSSLGHGHQVTKTCGPPGCTQVTDFGKIAQNGPFYTRKVLFFSLQILEELFRKAEFWVRVNIKVVALKSSTYNFFCLMVRSSCEPWRPKKFKKRVKNGKIRV